MSADWDPKPAELREGEHVDPETDTHARRNELQRQIVNAEPVDLDGLNVGEECRISFTTADSEHTTAKIHAEVIGFERGQDGSRHKVIFDGDHGRYRIVYGGSIQERSGDRWACLGYMARVEVLGGGCDE